MLEKRKKMAAHCLELSSVLKFAIWCLVCFNDSITTTMKFTIICNNGPCGFGERFDPTKSVCIPCEEGTFLDVNNHQCIQCIPCTQPNMLEHELVVRTCTATNDTEIGCDTLHYKAIQDDFREPYCLKCTQCGEGQRVVQKCGPDTDIVCVNDKLDTTTDSRDSSDVGGSVSYLVNTAVDTFHGNTSHIYNLTSSSNRSWSVTFVVVASVCMFVVAVVLATVCMIRKRRIYKMVYNKMIPTLPYRRMTNCEGDIAVVSSNCSSDGFVTFEIQS